MNNNVSKNIIQTGGIILLSVFLISNAFIYAKAEESDKISKLIGSLSENLNINYLTDIYGKIGNLSDPSAKLRFKEELHKKLDDIFESPSNVQKLESLDKEDDSSNTPAENLEAFNSETKYNALKLQIDALQSGPDVSSEIIRSRNDLIAEINNISDPNRRAELLRLMKEKETTLGNIPPE